MSLRLRLLFLWLVACGGAARDAEPVVQENPLAPGWVPFKKERDAYRAWLYWQEFIPVDYYPDAATCTPGEEGRRVFTVRWGSDGVSRNCKQERLSFEELCVLAKGLAAASGHRVIVYPGMWELPPWPALNQTARYALLHESSRRYLYLVSEKGHYYAARRGDEGEQGCVVDAGPGSIILAVGHRFSG